MPRTRLFAVVLAAGLAASVPVWLSVGATPPAAWADVRALPERLSDEAFWRLQADISEPGGYFRIADNFTSNEREVGRIVSMLKGLGINGGVYLGVGPEQNFSYIAAIRPAMAFIVDIRRQAVVQHLMFKAMFEMAEDRADFISILFARPRPDGLDPQGSISELWAAFEHVPADPDLAARYAARIVSRLTDQHGFALSAEELTSLRYVLQSFVSLGPTISTRGSGAAAGGYWRGSGGTFAELTGSSFDDSGTPQSFLSTDAHFQTVKHLHERNLIVPVSGDFGGPRALRAIGAYVQRAGATVSAFYVSNVEQYLFQDGKAATFYANVAALPITDRTVFIRPYAFRRGGGGPRAALCPMSAFLAAAQAGRIVGTYDTLTCAR